MCVSIIAASWCLVQGSTINASISVERRGKSIWGILLTLFGTFILFIGILVVPLLMLERFSPSTTLLSGALSLLLFTLVLIFSRSGGEDEGIKEALEKMGIIGNLTILVIIVSLILLLSGNFGGEIGVIPEAVWRPLLGSIVIVSGLITACLAITAGVKSGGEMLVNNEALSIWALLFVALGEGLAIYGLIISKLLIG